MDLDSIVNFLSQVNPILIYLTVFFIAYIENIFPPFPSDMVVVFAGSLAVVAKTTFFATLFFATLGSVTGFITMYWIGRWFGSRIIETGKLKFIPIENIHRVERWFNKFGYFIIVINRFLAGTRAIVAFFAGMSVLNYRITFFLSGLSALTWNVILVYSGYIMGRNWREIAEYIETYWKIVTSGIIILIVLWTIFLIVKKRKSKNA